MCAHRIGQPSAYLHSRGQTEGVRTSGVQVAYSSSIKNEAEKERNRAARQMDTLMKVIYVGGVPAGLHSVWEAWW
eukprot:scaffold31033_cov21-Tisochrysis_lutea.AAC.1